jgi:hypothetical protein
MSKFCCNGCVFALKEDFVQTGCSLNRLEKILGRDIQSEDYISVGDDLVLSYDKFCMTFRPETWLDNINGSPEKAVLEELTLSIGYIVEFKEDISTLHKTLDSLDKPSYVIVINSKPEYSEEIFEALDARYSDIPFNVVLLFEELEYNENIDQVFKKCRNGWIVLLRAGDTIPPGFYDAVFDRIYNQVRRLGVSFNKDRTKLLVQSQIFQFLGGNRPKINEDGTVDNRDFYERLFSHDVSDKDLIADWQELFNE